MEPLVQLIIVGLAAWRLAALLSYEAGPFGVFERWRSFITPTGEIVGPWARLRDQLAMIHECVWCLSPWMAALFWFWYGVEPVFPSIMAAAAIVVAVERWNRP